MHEEMQARKFPGLNGPKSRGVAGVLDTDVRQELVIVQGAQVRMVGGLGQIQPAEQSSDEPYHLVTRPPHGRGDRPAVLALHEANEHLQLDHRQQMRRP